MEKSSETFLHSFLVEHVDQKSKILKPWQKKLKTQAHWGSANVYFIKSCLIIISSVLGYYAFRRPDTGSWFIRGLCHVFSQPMAQKFKLTSLLTAVIWYISNEYESSSANQKISGKKQTPCIATMLVKDVYFRPSAREYSD